MTYKRTEALRKYHREWWDLHKDEQNEKRKQRYRNRKRAELCVICGRENDTEGTCCSRHAEYQNDFAKKVHKNRKLEIIRAYGGHCICCGETRIEFLTIDHINNDGAKHRKELGNSLDQKTPVAGSRFYVWLKKNNYPPGFQILCYNCNCAKGHFGYCPHNLEYRQDWNTDFGIAV